MNNGQKIFIKKTITYSLLAACLFIIKFYLVPLIPNIDLRGSSFANIFFNFILIPILIVFGMRKEPLIRYWLIPDFIYCLLSFLQAGELRPYGIGIYGLFISTYHWSMALIDRSITFIAIILFQFIVSLILKLFKKISKKKKIKQNLTSDLENAENSGLSAVRHDKA